jgi:hypothetical protein
MLSNAIIPKTIDFFPDLSLLVLTIARLGEKVSTAGFTEVLRILKSRILITKNEKVVSDVKRHFKYKRRRWPGKPASLIEKETLM